MDKGKDGVTSVLNEIKEILGAEIWILSHCWNVNTPPVRPLLQFWNILLIDKLRVTELIWFYCWKWTEHVTTSSSFIYMQLFIFTICFSSESVVKNSLFISKLLCLVQSFKVYKDVLKYLWGEIKGSLLSESANEHNEHRYANLRGERKENGAVVVYLQICIASL